MPDISIQLCRAARGILGWSQADLAVKSGVARSAIAGFEAGNSAPTPRTLRDIAAAFEAAGVLFIDPVEGVHQGAVGLKWGADAAKRTSSGASTGPAESSQADSQAIAWDDGIDALHEEVHLAADPEIEEMRTYWRANPEKWAAMHKSTRWALLGEMGLRKL